MPRDVSLISFDNTRLAGGLNISSVDFGFGYLGYSAFHFIMQDVPINRTRHGDIPARPHVAHRGSIAFLRPDDSPGG